MKTSLLLGILLAAPMVVLGGCEVALGVGSLTERADDGGAVDGTVDDGASDGGVIVIPDGSRDAAGDVESSADASSDGDAIDADAGCGVNGATCGDSGTCANGECIFPNCSPGGDGLTNCGTASESCCVSLPVPDGTFHRTYVYSDAGPTGEADLGSVSAFRLDKYLVTVGRFRQFVKAWNNGAGYAPIAGSGKHTHINGGVGLAATGGGYEPGWVATDESYVMPTDANLVSCLGGASATWTSSPMTNETLPITCANWWEAYAFCIWDGGFLPTDAEEEFAAAAGNQQRRYPWGEANPGIGNQYAAYGCYYPTGVGPCSSSSPINIAPVGHFPSGAGYWGQLDLAGDMFEFDLDWEAPFDDTCATDCANFTPASGRVVRGGVFDLASPDIVSSYRTYQPEAQRTLGIGFRCARTP